jgi:ATP-dependent DNA helicase RecG
MVLISTSVVEVGVDVPNATVMCIEGAERFGLSQLHQFRGRIGRGEYPSYCFLLPGALTAAVKDRLMAVVRHKDGFALAERDLEMRGPGDLLGTAQSGFPEFMTVALGDMDVIASAREAAASILAADPDLSRHPELARSLRAGIEEAHLE